MNIKVGAWGKYAFILAALNLYFEALRGLNSSGINVKFVMGNALNS